MSTQYIYIYIYTCVCVLRFVMFQGTYAGYSHIRKSCLGSNICTKACVDAFDPGNSNTKYAHTSLYGYNICPNPTTSQSLQQIRMGKTRALPPSTANHASWVYYTPLDVAKGLCGRFWSRETHDLTESPANPYGQDEGSSPEYSQPRKLGVLHALRCCQRPVWTLLIEGNPTQSTPNLCYPKATQPKGKRFWPARSARESCGHC
jgi:hypothetical protein